MMKALLIALAVLILAGIGYGIYKTTDIISLLPKNPQQRIEKQRDVLKGQAEEQMQKLASGAQDALQSGQQLFEEKKAEAEQYLKNQKELLKQDAQKKLEEEAKKKIQGVFSGM